MITLRLYGILASAVIVVSHCNFTKFALILKPYDNYHVHVSTTHTQPLFNIFNLFFKAHTFARHGTTHSCSAPQIPAPSKYCLHWQSWTLPATSMPVLLRKRNAAQSHLYARFANLPYKLEYSALARYQMDNCAATNKSQFCFGGLRFVYDGRPARRCGYFLHRR